MARWKLSLAAALCGATLAAPAARGIDLTGTWTARKVTCTVRSEADTGFREADSNLVTILLKQTGTDLWIEINPGPDAGYENKLKGSALTSPKSDGQGYAVATACTIDGKYYSGSMLITKAKRTGQEGSFSLLFQGRKFSNTVVTCKGRYELVDTASPSFATTCP